GGAMTQDGIEDAEQLVHTGDERHFLGLAGRAQALVEGTDDRVVPGRDQGGHVQDRAHPRPAPQTMRRPRNVPLSQLRGATPTSAVMALWPSRPSSGRSAKRVQAVVGPIL